MSIEEIIEKHKKLSKIVSDYKYLSKIYKDFRIINHYQTYDCTYYADITDSKNINYNIIDENYALNLELYIKDKKN